jgi:serine/threonine protein kinase
MNVLKNSPYSAYLRWFLGLAALFLALGVIMRRLRKKKPLPIPSQIRLETTLTEEDALKKPALTHAERISPAVDNKAAKQRPEKPETLKSGTQDDPAKTADDDTPLLPVDIGMLETRTIISPAKQPDRIGRYIVEKEIGHGSTGAVYKAWDPKLDRTVAIKKVNLTTIQTDEEIRRTRDRLYREARAAARLSHPNIVVIYDVGEEADFCFIVMEYLQGHDLKWILENRDKFTLSQGIDVLIQICQALDFAHKNDIVHRDIKPSNVILAADGLVKVADFGIAKLATLGTMTQTGNIVGTLYYMSPEQVEGRKLDGRTDIFSAGVVLYEMLLGRRPFEGTGIPEVISKIMHHPPPLPSSVDPNMPKELDNILACALAKEPDARYQQAMLFKQALVSL